MPAYYKVLLDVMTDLGFQLSSTYIALKNTLSYLKFIHINKMCSVDIVLRGSCNRTAQGRKERAPKAVDYHLSKRLS